MDEIREALSKATSLLDLGRLIDAYIVKGMLDGDQAESLYDEFKVELERRAQQVAFIGWLDETYGFVESKKIQALGAGKKINEGFYKPYYDYWVSVGTPGFERAEEFGEEEIPTLEDIEEEVKLIEDPDELQAALKPYVDSGAITKTQAKRLWGKYSLPIEAQEYLRVYTSKNDLADRLNYLMTEGWLEEGDAYFLYGDYTDVDEIEAGMAIRKAAERAEEAAYKVRVVETRAKGELAAAKFYGQQEQERLDRGLREGIEATTAYSALAGMAELAKRPTSQWQRPPLPSTEKVAKSFLKETGLAEGTRLRQFLEGKILPEVVGETREAREAWWKRMHQPQPDVPAALQLLEKEKWGWLDIMKEAPSTEEYGGIYFGEGGLKDLAQRSFVQRKKMLKQQTEEQQALVGQYEAEGYPGRPKPSPDPLIEALRRRKWRPEYMRRPGAGLVSRLTPAVRY